MPETEELKKLRTIVDSVIVAADPEAREATFSVLESGERWLLDAYRREPLRVAVDLSRAAKIRGFGTRVRELKAQLRMASDHEAAETARAATSAIVSLGSRVEAPSELAALLVPSGYEVDEDGVWQLNTNESGDVSRTNIAHRPVVVSGRAMDRESGEIWLTLSWMAADREWHRHAAPRRQALDARQLVELAGIDAPVTSGSAGALVKWLDDFEAINAENLQNRRISLRLGWYDPDTDAPTFVLPEGVIGSADLETVDDAGFSHLAEGWSTSGTFEAWLDGVRDVAEYPLVMLALYASVAAPLVEFLDAPNFVVDWSEDTSAGKTTALRLAASVWGRPTEDDGILYSWDETRVSILQKAAFLRNLPLILDESKRAKDKQTVSQTIYDFCHGRDRGRGLKAGGVRRQLGWRTVLLSSGEAPLAMYTSDAGTKARVLSFRGVPLGRDPDEGRRAAHALTDSVTDNYGHMGRRVISYLVEDAAPAREAIRAEYRRFRDAYAAQQDQAVSGRAAAYVAVLAVAASICHQFGVPVPKHDPIELALRAAARAGDDANIALIAMRDLLTWVVANPSRFSGRNSDMRAPSQGYAGTWRGGNEWETICVANHTAKKIMTEMGYHYEEVRQRWADRKYIETGKNGEPTRVSSMNSEPFRAIVIPRATFEGVFEEPNAR